VPFLLFISSAIVGVKEQHLEQGSKVFLTFIGASVFIAFALQLPYTFYFEDFISGFFANAHNFATWLSIISIVFFYDYVTTRKFTSLVASVVSIAFSVLPSNEKVFFFTLIILACMFMKNVVGNWTKLKRNAFYTCLVLIFLAGIFKVRQFLEGDSGGRLLIAINHGLPNLGPVAAWPIAFQEITASPLRLAGGVGAGQYGWIAAGRDVAEGKGSIHSNQFDIEFSTENLNNSGFLFRTNTWSSLLAEFGWLGFIMFSVLLWLIVNGVRQAVPQSRLEANLRIAFFAIVGLVIFQGFFTPYSNWSESVLMFPAMFIASYFFNPIRKSARQEI
jgi:hypothetical protein